MDISSVVGIKRQKLKILRTIFMNSAQILHTFSRQFSPKLHNFYAALLTLRATAIAAHVVRFCARRIANRIIPTSLYTVNHKNVTFYF